MHHHMEAIIRAGNMETIEAGFATMRQEDELSQVEVGDLVGLMGAILALKASITTRIASGRITAYHLGQDKMANIRDKVSPLHTMTRSDPTLQPLARRPLPCRDLKLHPPSQALAVTFSLRHLRYRPPQHRLKRSLVSRTN